MVMTHQPVMFGITTREAPSLSPDAQSRAELVPTLQCLGQHSICPRLVCGLVVPASSDMCTWLLLEHHAEGKQQKRLQRALPEASHRGGGSASAG